MEIKLRYQYGKNNTYIAKGKQQRLQQKQNCSINYHGKKLTIEKMFIQMSSAI